MWITRSRFKSNAKWFIFSVLYIIFSLNFVKIFLAYGQMYSLEISGATGVIDHTESEYAIFIIREPTREPLHGDMYTHN